MRISDWSSDVCSSDLRLTAYCHWLATARALSPSGIEETVKEVKRWYAQICGDGKTCSTEALRSILLDQAPHRSRGSIDRTVSTLRSFVRFLIARAECPRSEERRVGKEWVSPLKSRWRPDQ